MVDRFCEDARMPNKSPSERRDCETEMLLEAVDTNRNIPSAVTGTAVTLAFNTPLALSRSP